MPYSPHSRCRMDRERFGPGGRECFGLGVQTWRAQAGEAEAIAFPLAGGFPLTETRAKPATGPGSRSTSAQRRGGGTGTGLWRTWVRACITQPDVMTGCHEGPAAEMHRSQNAASVRAGPRQTHLPGLSRPGPEQSGRGTKIPEGARHRLSDLDTVRRLPGRARAAPPRAGLLPIPHTHTQFVQKALPACGPPDFIHAHTPAEIFARARLRLP